MSPALSHEAKFRATGEVGAHRDGDQIPAPHLPTIQRLYDTALPRSAGGGNRPFQRYLAVLIQAPRSARPGRGDVTGRICGGRPFRLHADLSTRC
jgi:hypothetical protein